MTIIKTARNLIASGEESQCVTALIDWLNNFFEKNKELKANAELKEIYNEFYFISSTLNNHKKEKLQGTAPDSLVQEKNKSTKYLLSNISKLEYFFEKNESALHHKSYTSHVEITINAEFDEFSEKDVFEFVKELGSKLKINESEIKIKMKKSGSVKLVLELPSNKVMILKKLFLSGKLDSLNVMDTKLLEGMNLKNLNINDLEDKKPEFKRKTRT